MAQAQEQQTANEAAVSRGQSIVEDYCREIASEVGEQAGLIAVLLDLMHYADENPDTEFDAALEDARARLEVEQERDDTL